MATALGCENGPGELVQVLPFFRDGVIDINGSLTLTKPFPISLDGTADHDTSLHRQQTVARFDQTAQHSLPAAPPPRLGNERSMMERWSVSERDELEVEYTQRKRRRVSVEPTGSPMETDNNLGVIPKTWHEQLHTASLSCEGGMTPAHEHHSERSAEQLPAVDTKAALEPGSAPTMKEISEGDSDLPGTLESSETLASRGSESKPSLRHPHPKDSLSEEEMLRCTPKTKIMRIGSNGKLTNSPKRSSRQSLMTKKPQDDHDHGTQSMRRSSRKVEIKNGKLVSSLRVIVPYQSPDCGRKIDEILSHKGINSDTPLATTKPSRAVPTGNKATHPFFLGRLALKPQKQPPNKTGQFTLAQGSDNESNQDPPEAPKPWSDIKFTTKKPLERQMTGSLPTIWPPHSLQRVQPGHDSHLYEAILPYPVTALKSKHRVSNINSDEDILWVFARDLGTAHRGLPSLHLPKRRLMSGRALNAALHSELGTQEDYSDHLKPLRARIESTLSPFDKGMAAGPQMWPQEYAPTCWQEVLQPQVQILYDWLRNLTVHQVQSGKLQAKPKPSAPKKRRKRRSDDMDNFIVNSDDEDEASAGKNAILISGPQGCGKTAAVFTVAQQLGFEIFEIHAGMRRSARDIQERVGDMTQNHLVQQASSLSRGSSVSLDDSPAASSTGLQQLAANQSTVATFLNLGKGTMGQKPVEASGGRDMKIKAQKQSLILLEEVDILFDDDKGFWSGVQSLIRTSKRPVIMTCNNLESIPLDELDLFTILVCELPETKLAVERLGCVAAAEGHLLGRQALEDLYSSKGRDLRASLTELNLWCQMAVGSQQGGLDWMLPHDMKRQAAQDGSVMRIVSQDTFVSGLDLYPTELDDPADMVKFAQESLDLAPLDWVKDIVALHNAGNTDSNLRALEDMLLVSDARSTMDGVHTDVACLMAGMMLKQRTPAAYDDASPRQEVVRHYLEQQNTTHPLSRAAVADVLEALMEESRIGLPVSPGRKAPSLDNFAQSLVTEVAPYVRSIVAHDQRLEHIRNELGGGDSQIKRQRKTRASRAALEGGSKVTTRRDKWFPEILNFADVLATGGNGWPQFTPPELEAPSATATPASSMATEVDGDTLQA